MVIPKNSTKTMMKIAIQRKGKRKKSLRLTDKDRNKLLNYYGITIRSSTGDSMEPEEVDSCSLLPLLRSNIFRATSSMLPKNSIVVQIPK